MRAACATLIACLACVCAVARPAESAPLTTAPSVFVDVRVTLTDTGVKLSRRSAPRGAIVRFSIRNTGKRPHSFTFATFNSAFRMPTGFSRVLAPAQHRQVLLFLDYRGVLHFHSRVGADARIPAMRGTFRIGPPPKSKVDA